MGHLASQRSGGTESFLALLIDLCATLLLCIKKLIDRNCTLLNFWRSVAQSLITLGKPPKVGRPISTPSNRLTAKKRRKTNYSVPASIKKENSGIHWVIYDQKHGRCELCLKKKFELRPFLKCSACKDHLCINDKRNCFSDYHM